MRFKLIKYLFFILLTGSLYSSARAQAGLCPDNLDFEKGSFSGWICKHGVVDQIGGINTITWTSIGPPVATFQTMISALTPGLDPYGNFPKRCPNGSNFSVKIGNETASLTGGIGKEASGISYIYTIPAGIPAFSILFHYAVVLENPPHTLEQQPRFRARIKDLGTGMNLPCVDFDFISGNNTGGFKPSQLDPNVLYKDWTPVSIDLTYMAGRTIEIEFIATECTQQGHFGYAYVDVNSGCNGVISGNNICPGDSAITLTAPFGFQSYEWYSDLSFTTMISNSQTLYLNPPPAVGSVYPVIVIPYLGFGCRDTLLATITVGTKPVSNAGPDVDICRQQPVLIGTLANPFYSYQWTPAAQVSNPFASSPFAWTITAFPEEFIIKTTDILTGCVAYDTTYIRARQADTAIILSGSNIYCLGDPAAGTLSVHNVLSAVQWYNGTTRIPGATGFSYHPTVSGNYWAQVLQYDCTDSTATIPFVIGPIPVSIAGRDASICTNNQTIQIGALPNPAYNYSWTPAGQVNNPAIANPIAWAIGATTTEFIVHTTEPLSGCNSYDTVYITGRVVDTVILLNGSNTYCAGDPTAGILSVHNVLSAVQWYNGPTPIPGATGFTYQPTVSGNYWAQVQQNGCTDSTATIAFSINPVPVSVAGPDASICTNNQTIQIGALPNLAYNYSWTPAGQVNNPAIANPIAWAIGATTTEFIVHTIDPLSGCNSYDTMYITGRVVDTALQLNGSTTYCAPDPSAGTLSVHNVLSAVQWFNGLTPIPGATGFMYQPTVSGNYWAQVQQNGCTDSTATITFIISPIPLSIAGPDASICTNNQTIQIGAPPNPAYNYSWTPAGQVNNPAIANPVAWAIGATTTEFIVHTIDPLSGCNSYDTVYITGRVVDTVILLNGSNTYCAGDPTAGILSVHNVLSAVQWYNGPTLIPGATGFTYQPTVSGNYWAQVQQNGCTDSTSAISFSINPVPVSIAGPDASICTNNQTIQIGTLPNPAYNYSWTPAGQVNNPAIANPIAWTVGATPVQFIVHTTDPLTGCNSYDTTIVTGRVVDTAIHLNGKNDFCDPDPAAGTLSVNNIVSGVQWYNGASPIPGATGFNYQPLATGNYWAQVQQFGCTDSTATISFAIHARPLVSFTASNDTGCVTNHSFIFTNASSASDGSTLSYLWRLGDGSTQTVTDAIKTYTTVGNYLVKLVATTSFGCKDSSNNMMVHVLPNANADFKWDSICTNRPVFFYNLSNEHGSAQVNYNWTFNNGAPGSTIRNPLPVIYNTVGQTDVTLILTALGCENDPDTITKRVQVNVQKPGITYQTITVPQGSSQFIHVRDTVGTIYNWRPHLQLSSYDTRYTQFFATGNDVKYLIDISDSHTCITTDTMQMLVLKKPGFYLPTAFTPNGDGLNDVVQPYLIGMKGLISFSVFNRWGNLVFHTTRYGETWNGKFQGVDQNPGVFVWMIEFYNSDNKKVMEKGTITLIR